VTDHVQYTPGPAGAQVRKGGRSGRRFSSESCATRRKKSGRALRTRRICASGLALKPMGAWVRLEPW